MTPLSERALESLRADAKKIQSGNAEAFVSGLAGAFAAYREGIISWATLGDVVIAARRSVVEATELTVVAAIIEAAQAAMREVPGCSESDYFSAAFKAFAQRVIEAKSASTIYENLLQHIATLYRDAKKEAAK